MFESLNYRGLRETALLTAMVYGGSGSHYRWQQIPTKTTGWPVSLGGTSGTMVDTICVVFVFCVDKKCPPSWL